MVSHRFLKAPTLGGWLTIINALPAPLIMPEFVLRSVHYYRGGNLDWLALVLYPFAWPFILLWRPADIDPATAIIKMLAVGVNSFLWGYGVAAIYQWIWTPKPKLRSQQKPLCGRCGYNLRGNASGTCPECGTPWREGGGWPQA